MAATTSQVTSVIGRPAASRPRELNLDRVHPRDVVHHDSDLATVLWNAHLPFGFGEIGRKFG